MAEHYVMSLEEKAADAVKTAKKIKGELEKYRKQTSSFDALVGSMKDLLEEVTRAVQGLEGVSENLNKGDVVSLLSRFGEGMDRLEATVAESARETSERLGGVEEAVRKHDADMQELLKQGKGIASTLERLDEKLADLGEVVRQPDADVRTLLEWSRGVAPVIGRIDLNTQKGFGKIKG